MTVVTFQNQKFLKIRENFPESSLSINEVITLIFIANISRVIFTMVCDYLSLSLFYQCRRERSTVDGGSAPARRSARAKEAEDHPNDGAAEGLQGIVRNQPEAMQKGIKHILKSKMGQKFLVTIKFNKPF